MNAVITAARNGVSLYGGIIYTTHRPCVRCTSALIQAGIQEIVWVNDYTSEDPRLAEALLQKTEVWIRRFDSGTQ